MSRFESPLKELKVASPCSANWDEMFGDERKRFCGDCSLHVYNLSGMTRDEAEAFLIDSEGRVCVRYYQRSDGSVITRDCPVGWAKLKRRMSVAATAFVSLFISLFGSMFITSLFARKSLVPVLPVIPKSSPENYPVMGAISVKPPDKNKDGAEKFSVAREKVLRASGI